MASLEIPLFPLRTVLFPGHELPLQIFEDRYKTMTRELLESGGVFGVILIKHGSEVGGSAVPHEVGTTAVIEDHRELPGGRFQLDARGRDRFRLVRMLSPRPYPYGEIEFLDEAYDPLDAQLQAAFETARATFPLYLRLALALSDQWARDLTLPREPHRFVNTVAPWLQVDEEGKQRLLEIESAAGRLGQLAEQLDGLISRIREQVDNYHRQRFASLSAIS